MSWLMNFAQATGVIPDPKTIGQKKDKMFRPAYGLSEGAVDKIIKRERKKTITLQGQIAASKALGAFVSIREMRASQRAHEAAGIPLKKTRHGVIVPVGGTGRAATAQQFLLSDAQRSARDVSGDLYKYAVRSEALESKVSGLYGDIAGLRQKLRERPPTIERSLFGDLSAMDFTGLKEIAIVGIIALAGASVLGGALKR